MKISIILISLTGFSIGTFCILTGYLIEKRYHSKKQNFSDILFNILYFLPASLLQTMLMPVAATMTAFAVGAAGGGFIALQDKGWRLLTDLLLYVLAMDFGEYIFHRAQHRFAFLWSMHALHHSDTSLNISTTVRHYWAEHLIKSVTVYLVIAIAFKLNTIIAGLYTIISFYNYFSHMNVKLGFGRWSLALNSPQYHRIHHSILDDHRNCNFAALFPVFDYIFGSHRIPKTDEFPPTGLSPLEYKPDIVSAFIWPAGASPPRSALK